MTQTKPHPTNFQGNLYPKIASELSGDVQDIDKWQEGQILHQKLLSQSHWVAQQLEEEGVEAYNEQDLTLVGLHSRQAKKIPNFRNINFIPYVARKNRKKQCKDLNYYLEHNRNCRLWTITTGARCNAEDLEARVRILHRRISRLNSEPWMKQAGASFVFRATEFGEVAPIGSTDLSFHPHCHALLKLERILPKAEWSNLLSAIRAYLGAYSQDNGRIQNPRELVKYCVKPSDLEHLSSAQIRLLFETTQGLRLCESLQGFRKLRSQIREEKLKVVLRKGSHRLVPAWNQGINHDDLPLYLQEPDATEREPEPSVLAWCVPAPVFTPVTEPVFLVHGLKHRDPASVFVWPEVIEMQRAIKVHTEILTVREKQAERKRSHESSSKVYLQTSPPT